MNKIVKKTRRFTAGVLCLVVVGLFVAYSCDKPDTPSDGDGKDSIKPVLSLEGTKWKLAGIVDVETGSMRVLEPQDCDYCYTLVFADNFTSLPIKDTVINGTDTIFCKYYYANGRSCFNQMWLLSLDPIYFGYTKAGECGDGEAYFNALWKVNSYAFNKNELKCFYKEKNTNSSKYLLYKPLHDPIVYTTWKLAGMVDEQTGKLREFEPKGDRCYTFEFNLIGFIGIVSPDYLIGNYKFNSTERTIHLLEISDLAENETEIGDGDLYRKIVKTVQSFSYQNNELRMYFKNIDNISGYLVFKKD